MLAPAFLEIVGLRLMVGRGCSPIRFWGSDGIAAWSLICFRRETIGLSVPDNKLAVPQALHGGVVVIRVGLEARGLKRVTVKLRSDIRRFQRPPFPYRRPS